MNIEVQNQEVDTSEDEKLTEANALEQAEEAGIKFVDRFAVVEVATLSKVSEDFETREEAEAVLADSFSNSESYTIQQSRSQVFTEVE